MSGLSVTDGVATVGSAPPGYVVDFAHPQRDNVTDSQIYSVFGVGLVLSSLFLYQNIHIHLVVERTFNVEVGCLVVAWISVVFVQACLICKNTGQPPFVSAAGCSTFHTLLRIQMAHG
jgi:hypothetical protein